MTPAGRNSLIAISGITFVGMSAGIGNEVGKFVSEYVVDQAKEAEYCSRMPERSNGNLPPEFLKACSQAIARVYEPYQNYDNLTEQQKNFSNSTQRDISAKLILNAEQDKKDAVVLPQRLTEKSIDASLVIWLFGLGTVGTFVSMYKSRQKEYTE